MLMAEAIKAVIFDIGGVVAVFSNNAYYKYLAKASGLSVSQVRKAVLGRVPAFETGKLTIRRFEAAIAASLGIKAGDVMWLRFYKKHVTVDTDVVDLIRELHNSYVTACITNIDASKYAFMNRLLGRYVFDYRFASCNVHIRKPDRRIYRYALGKLKLMPKETLFIDNQIENVRGARSIGMHSVLYKNRRQLDISLDKLLE